MICQNCRSSIATSRYVYGLNGMRKLSVLCAPCAGSLVAIGMDLRAGRSSDRDLSREDTRPAWVRNLKAKDFTGSIA
jgi:hypothetical protein